MAACLWIRSKLAGSILGGFEPPQPKSKARRKAGFLLFGFARPIFEPAGKQVHTEPCQRHGEGAGRGEAPSKILHLYDAARAPRFAAGPPQPKNHPVLVAGVFFDRGPE